MAFYAVRVGLTPGIYESWDECKTMVIGYPKAEYKKFATYPEAEQYMGKTPTTTPTVPDEEYPSEARTPGVYVAYTDGSYNLEDSVAGAGLVLFHDGIKSTFNDVEHNEEATKMRNVAGEILAAEMAIDMAIAAGASKLIIRHDYTGISEWAELRWKAKNPFTAHYQSKACGARLHLQLVFEHIDAHTGNAYNEEADRLAKKAVGLE